MFCVAHGGWILHFRYFYFFLLFFFFERNYSNVDAESKELTLNCVNLCERCGRARLDANMTAAVLRQRGKANPAEGERFMFL